MTAKWDLKPVIDLAIEYNPNLAVADIHTPRMWVNEGCDILLDAVPAMTEVIAWAKKHGRRIGSFAYFNDPVRKARDKRLQSAATKKPETGDVEARKAKHIAWARDRKIACVGIGPAEFRWLSEYEQQHGKVTA